METTSRAAEPIFDVIENIEKHVAQLKPYVPERGLICIGEYPLKILQKEPFFGKNADILPIVVTKSERMDEQPAQSGQFAAPQNTLTLDSDVDTHFWFNVNAFFAANEEQSSRLMKTTEKLHEAVIFV